jgi:oxalate decarboxylase
MLYLGDPMSFRRRDFLTGTAAIAAGMTAALVGTKRVDAGDPSFMNNVPDPLLSDKELPTFKFALEKSKGRVSGQNYAKEATVKQLPISKGIAGVTMGLAPGPCGNSTGMPPRPSGRS